MSIQNSNLMIEMGASKLHLRKEMHAIRKLDDHMLHHNVILPSDNQIGEKRRKPEKITKGAAEPEIPTRLFSFFPG